MISGTTAIRRLTRNAQKLYEQIIINQIKDNLTKFWQYAQAKLKIRTGMPNFMKTELKDDMSNSDLEKAELLANSLSSVFTREPQECLFEEPTRCYNIY